MNDHLFYSGQYLFWYLAGRPVEAYRATSGIAPARPILGGRLPGNQQPNDQCVKDAGPVPEGKYYLTLSIDAKKPYAVDDGTNRCTLRASNRIQRIPRGGDASSPPSGAEAGMCEGYWANWGYNRVRLEPADNKTRWACGGTRSGFYLHDSTKGYSHGCVEVEGRFFAKLYDYARKHPRQRMYLFVRYVGSSTYGGTDLP